MKWLITHTPISPCDIWKRSPAFEDVTHTYVLAEISAIGSIVSQYAALHRPVTSKKVSYDLICHSAIITHRRRWAADRMEPLHKSL